MLFISILQMSKQAWEEDLLISTSLVGRARASWLRVRCPDTLISVAFMKQGSAWLNATETDLIEDHANHLA